MQDMITRLIDANASDYLRMREIVEAAVTEARELNAAEDANLTAINATMDSRTEQRLRLEAAEAAAAANDEARSRIVTVQTPERATASETSSDILVRMVTAGAGAHEFESRALATGTALNPVEFLPRLAVYMRTLNPTLGLATVYPSDNGNSMTLPRLTADSSVYTPGEGTAIDESTPTISAVTLTVTSWKGLAYLSNELVQDTPVAIEQAVINSAGRQIGLTAGAEWTTGSTGFISLATNGGTAAKAGGTAIDTAFFLLTDLMDLYHGLPAPYRLSPTAAWQVSNTALAKMRRASATNGQFLFQPAGLSGQQYDTFLGKRVYENPTMAAVASATKSVAFGDWSAYVIKEAPVRVEVSREFKFDTDQTAVRIVYRAGAALPDAAAIRYMVSANT